MDLSGGAETIDWLDDVMGKRPKGLAKYEGADEEQETGGGCPVSGEGGSGLMPGLVCALGRGSAQCQALGRLITREGPVLRIGNIKASPGRTQCPERGQKGQSGELVPRMANSPGGGQVGKFLGELSGRDSGGLGQG
uniref:Uncharacterized protein n=1 Tax=Myotis myotis TaxID=51298 RepID=A0A7J7T6G7_MYOMY|nr:hypothetical protein mMyoMyo1_009222 [Myotis myotis]